MTTLRVLVTGGAGFVGSHMVAALLEQGAEVVVFDNLSTGHEAAVLPGARLVRGDLANPTDIDTVFASTRFDAVFHFASLSLVGDSMREPMQYLGDNVGNGIRLIDACLRHGVGRFVLSSTAALFGKPDRMPIDEQTLIFPGSPYGESKHMLERALLMRRWAGVRPCRYSAMTTPHPTGPACVTMFMWTTWHRRISVRSPVWSKAVLPTISAVRTDIQCKR